MIQQEKFRVEIIKSTETYGEFSVQPLEKGFGITLGNALRRVLLGSLPGAAVTWVKIEGILHEFSPIPYIKEDTIDFLLNVKLLCLRPLSQNPGLLTLEVEGEGEVCAADIKLSSDFEIINPELHLATLDSPEAKLYVEFNVELGKGFRPASLSDSLPVGAIPVDAIFSPVRRVNFTTQPFRTGLGESYEQLFLVVWTNGAMSPVEALSQGASILIEHLFPFKALAGSPMKELAEASPISLSSEEYNKPLDQFNFSTRTFNSLRRAGITTLGKLLEVSAKGLSPLPGLGAKSRAEVMKKLESLGFPTFEAKAK